MVPKLKKIRYDRNRLEAMLDQNPELAWELLAIVQNQTRQICQTN